MISLGIDAHSKVCGVGIVKDNKIIGEINLNNGFTHSEVLLNCIDILLKELSLTINDIDNIGVSIGPGSYTGLRIGIATVKGLVFNKNINITGFSSLDLLGENVRKNNYIICPMINARNDNAFSKAYILNNNIKTILCEENLYNIKDLIDNLIKNYSHSILIVSDFNEEIKEILKENKSNIEYSDFKESMPRGGNAALITEKNIKDGKSLLISELAANYIRPSKAEQMKN